MSVSLKGKSLVGSVGNERSIQVVASPRGNGGISPEITVQEIENGHRVSVTDIKGTTTFDVMDGERGAPGYTPVKGIDYFDGNDGDSIYVSSVVTSEEDGGENVVTFSDGKTLTVRNGSKGSSGESGGLAPLIVNGNPKCGTFIEAGDGFVRYTAAEPLKNSATGETISATEMFEEFDKGRYVHIRLYNTSADVFISQKAPTFPDITYVEAGVISAKKHPLMNAHMFTAIGTANSLDRKYSYRVQIDVTGSNNPEITATLYKAYEDEKETIYAEVDNRIANNNTTVYAEVDKRIGVRSGKEPFPPIDPAIVNNLFRCAMSYVNHIDDLIFTGSGTGSQFDTNFNKDNPLMDCSSMMMAWVQGIPYEYSKYNGFDNIRHYRYGINLPSNPYSEVRPNRYYMHELAHYFDDMGYCFKPNSDYSNIAPGDIIFVSFGTRDGDTFHENAYMKIDHGLLVVGYKDATHLTCLHSSETSTFKFYDVCVKPSAYDGSSTNSYNDGIVLVARLPYKPVGSLGRLPIYTDSTEKTTTSTSNGRLATLTPQKALKKNTPYTLVAYIDNAFEQTGASGKNYAGVRASFQSGADDATVVSWQYNKNPDDNVYYFRFVVGDDPITELQLYVLNTEVAGHTYKFAQLYEGLVFPNVSEDDLET